MSSSFPQLIVIEDEPDLRQLYVSALAAYGFDAIETIGSTETLVEQVARLYTRPTLLVSDYCVPPFPPSRFLPELRRRGLEIPAVIVSGRIRAAQINDLCLSYPVRGFFEKTARFNSVLEAIGKHLIDLAAEADLAWKRNCAQHEARDFVARLSIDECTALLRLLMMDEPKVVAAETGFGAHRVYAMRRDMLSFLGNPYSMTRHIALDAVLRGHLGLEPAF